jgi:hypothetical protein
VIALPIYDWSVTTGCAVMAAIAVLERTTSEPERHPLALPVRLSALSVQPGILVLCIVLGAAGGGLWQVQHGTTYVARAQIYLPADQSAPQNARESTLDTAARFVNSPAVLAAGGAGRRADLLENRGGLSITATANTRILDLAYTSTNRARAGSAVTTMAHALANAVHARSVTDHRVLRAGLRQRLQGDFRIVSTIGRTLALTPGAGATLGTLLLQATRVKARQDAVNLTTTHREVDSADQTRGTVVGPASVAALPQQRNVSIGSGLLLGLLAGIGSERIRRRFGLRIGRATSSQRQIVGLTLPIYEHQPFTAAAHLSADPADPALCVAARRWDLQARHRLMTSTPVVLVAATTTRCVRVAQTTASLRNRGVPVAGVYVVPDI